MTRGQIAYEADVKAIPNYHDGKPRRKWDELAKPVQDSWERSPFSLPCAPIDTGYN